MYRYRHSRLLVASEIELPEWEGFACLETDTADVRIELADADPQAIPSDGMTATAHGVARFAIDGIGSWEIERGERIRLCPDPEADLRELRLFTLGSAWGLLGYQRGFAMWHGSSVSSGGKAVLFCGDAGEGKSTMAAAMIAEGAVLVADDLSRIEPCLGGPIIHPSSSRLKLWDEAVDHFGWRDRVLQRDFFRENKFHCRMPAHHAGQAGLPLSLVVALETGPELLIEGLEGGEAVSAVLKGTVYRPEALDAMDLWTGQGVLASRIVAGCQVVRLKRPRDLGAMGDCVDLVSEYLGSHG